MLMFFFCRIRIKVPDISFSHLLCQDIISPQGLIAPLISKCQCVGHPYWSQLCSMYLLCKGLPFYKYTIQYWFFSWLREGHQWVSAFSLVPKRTPHSPYRLERSTSIIPWHMSHHNGQTCAQIKDVEKLICLLTVATSFYRMCYRTKNWITLT